MLTKKLSITLVALAITAFGFALFAPATSLASTKGELCSGANLDISGDSTNCTPKGEEKAEDSINALIKKIVNILSIIVGVAAVIMIIYGGFRYVTSGGDSGNITTAKNTIIYALVGLVVVALAQGIVRFVLSLLDKS